MITPSSVIAFWKEAGPEKWFAKDEAFDALFRDRGRAAHWAAARRELDGWAESAPGSLALAILLDQFPRNAFRGSGHMYATDGLCRCYARAAEARGHMRAVEPPLRLFFALPFAHSEELSDQELSVALNRRLGRPWLDHAEGHRAIIRRFGRFPHRNPLLGRETTVQEAAFLSSGGFSG